jgi:hypothetical protein
VISVSIDKSSELFAAVLLFKLFLFSALCREIVVLGKMEMAREIELKDDGKIRRQKKINLPWPETQYVCHLSYGRFNTYRNVM